MCGVGLFRTIVNDSTHCVLFFGTRLDLFRTIETIFFTTKNESKFVLCATGCTPRMDLFRTIKTFFVPAWYKKSFNSTKPLRILGKIGSRFENDRHASGDMPEALTTEA